MTFLAAVIVFICIYTIVPSCLVSEMEIYQLLYILLYAAGCILNFFYYVFWLLALLQKYLLKRVDSFRNETQLIIYLLSKLLSERATLPHHSIVQRQRLLVHHFEAVFSV